MRNIVAVAVLALVVAACRAPTPGRIVDDRGYGYEPTRPEDVEVLPKVPPGGVVIGEVEGRGTKAFLETDEAIFDAQDLAAQLGADAIVITSPDTLIDASAPFQRVPSRLHALAIRRRR
jgi:hypothetical protein